MSLLPSELKSGEVARLIPVIADSRKEQRATSVFLATLTAVPDFSKAILESLGQRIGSRVEINTFTEIVLARTKSASNDRPDGFIVISTGKKRWSALIEAKIGKANLEPDQVERYIQLAREHSIDAVVTISNQFVSRPDHHPMTSAKSIAKKVQLFHWSWKYLLTEAILLQENKRISDPDQAFLLREFIRFFSHDSAGVSSFDQMPPAWKTILDCVQTGNTIKRFKSEAEDVVGAWSQEIRDVSLILSRYLGIPVTLKLSKKQQNDPSAALQDSITDLDRNAVLEAVLNIPNAASEVKISADLRSRTIRIAMTLQAPGDKAGGKARVNWLLRQLKDSSSENVFISAVWPSRAPDTTCKLDDLREEPECILTEGNNSIPRAFDVFYLSDNPRRFVGRKTFIEELETAVPHFYDQLGQHLVSWQPRPPKPKAKKAETDITVEADHKLESESKTATDVQQKVESLPQPGNDHSALLEIPTFLRRIPSSS